jgi:enterochelin esterase-like enzyme
MLPVPITIPRSGRSAGFLAGNGDEIHLPSEAREDGPLLPSSAVFVEPSDLFARLASASSGLKNSFSYVQIAVGRRDPLYSGSAVIDDYLTAQGIAHEFTLTPGQHSWVTWRPYLVDFLQKFCASPET